MSSDELPLGGEVKGRDQVMANFAQIPNYWSSFSVDARGVHRRRRVRRRHAGHSGPRNDKGSFEAPFLHLLKYNGDGKVVRGEFFTDSAKAAKLL